MHTLLSALEAAGLIILIWAMFDVVALFQAMIKKQTAKQLDEAKWYTIHTRMQEINYRQVSALSPEQIQDELNRLQMETEAGKINNGK